MRYDPTFLFRRARPPATPLACALLLTFALLVPDPAFAADNIFGTNSPLQRFVTFITGMFAYMLVIVGLIVTLGGLILGSDMSGFSRRAPLVVVSGAVLILADIMVGALFGAQGGYELPTVTADLAPPHSPVPASITMQTLSFPWAGAQLDGPLGPGFALITGPGAVLLLGAGLVAIVIGLFRREAATGLMMRGPLLVLSGVVLLLANMTADRLFGTIGDPIPEQAETQVAPSEDPAPEPLAPEQGQ